MSRLRILDEAADELTEAADYLEQERPGYARVFLAAYAEKVEQILAFPSSGPAINHVPTDLRVFSIQRFHYSIIVGMIGGVPTIIAVAHQHREPGYWRKRLTNK